MAIPRVKAGKELYLVGCSISHIFPITFLSFLLMGKEYNKKSYSTVAHMMQEILVTS